jgi:hypothetical protein
MIRTPSPFRLVARPALGLALLLTLAGPRLAAAQTAAPPPEAAPPPPAIATAEPAPSASGFGAGGQWVLSMSTTPDDANGYFLFHKTSGGTSSLQLSPAVDVFIGGNISLGVNLHFVYNSAPIGGSSSTMLGAGVRAGYNINLSSNVGFWPDVRFFVDHNGAGHSTATTFAVFAPFLWHLVPHFFLGAGPDLDRGISGGTYTEYGIDFILGGWF